MGVVAAGGAVGSAARGRLARELLLDSRRFASGSVAGYAAAMSIVKASELLIGLQVGDLPEHDTAAGGGGVRSDARPEHEDAAWAWMNWAKLLDGLPSKQVELVVADLVVGAFLLYSLMGPRGPIAGWRRPYVQAGEKFVFESDGKELQTAWGVLLREAVRVSREQRAAAQPRAARPG